MKPKWSEKEIKDLFDIVEKNNQKNLPMLSSFKEYAKLSNRNVFSVRNFYYTFLKTLQNNDELQKKCDINISKHKAEIFEHFDEKSSEKLKNDIEKLTTNGMSTRGACLKLSNGDIKQMLRLQNKYRSMKEKETKVYKFPIQSTNKSKYALTDEDIKSLFMGLVNLVKESAKSDSQKKLQLFLEQTEEDKRKHLVELEQKQFEIDRLEQSINELKMKNALLNKSLQDYRIDYLNSNTPSKNF